MSKVVEVAEVDSPMGVISPRSRFLAVKLNGVKSSAKTPMGDIYGRYWRSSSPPAFTSIAPGSGCVICLAKIFRVGIWIRRVSHRLRWSQVA